LGLSGLHPRRHCGFHNITGARVGRTRVALPHALARTAYSATNGGWTTGSSSRARANQPPHTKTVTSGWGTGVRESGCGSKSRAREVQ
jgi:hypothetical protein